jgi:hypothetical protein
VHLNLRGVLALFVQVCDFGVSKVIHADDPSKSSTVQFVTNPRWLAGWQAGPPASSWAGLLQLGKL